MAIACGRACPAKGKEWFARRTPSFPPITDSSARTESRVRRGEEGVHPGLSPGPWILARRLHGRYSPSSRPSKQPTAAPRPCCSLRPSSTSSSRCVLSSARQTGRHPRLRPAQPVPAVATPLAGPAPAAAPLSITPAIGFGTPVGSVALPAAATSAAALFPSYADLPYLVVANVPAPVDDPPFDYAAALQAMRAKYRPSERRRNEILSNADSVRYADIPPPFPTITQINYPIVGRVASGRAPTTASTSKNPMSGPTATTSAPVAGPSNHRGPPTASTSSLPMSGPPATTSSAGIGAPPTAAKSHVVGSSDGSTSLGARFAVDPFPRFGEYPIYALVSDADGRLHPQPRPPCRPELPERDESRDILFSRKLALGDVVGWFNEPKALYEQRVTEKLIGRREFEDGPPVREEDVDCDTLGVVWVVGEGGYLAAMMDDAGGFHKTINFTTQAPVSPVLSLHHLIDTYAILSAEFPGGWDVS